MTEWEITGADRRQVMCTIRVPAQDRNEAIRKASLSPHCLIVKTCAAVDGETEKQAARSAAIRQRLRSSGLY